MSLELEINQNIAQAVQIIAEGRVVAFPTGTSYGFAVDATRGWPLTRLRNLKQRPHEKTFSIFMKESLYERFLDLTPEEEKILNAHNKQAFTILVKPKEDLVHLAKDGLVAVRMVDHELMAQLADAAETPLTATSANVSGQPSAFSPEEIAKQFSNPLPDEKIPHTSKVRGLSETTFDLTLGMVLDGGHLPPVEPSKLAKIVDGELELVAR